jgi:ADP-ribose pyrophosphatase YjhB (NUDIX family)
MNYCNQCGAGLRSEIPEGDDRLRYVCTSCEWIHYENPRIIVGCLPVWEEEILLCRRSIEPRRGYWTLPCGFMENGERVEDGALRETLEEANARVEIENLHTLYSVVHVNQVYLIFLARLVDLEFFPGYESLETVLFKHDQIPWEEIAFSSVRFCLENYVKDFPNLSPQPIRGSLVRNRSNTPRPGFNSKP